MRKRTIATPAGEPNLEIIMTPEQEAERDAKEAKELALKEKTKYRKERRHAYPPLQDQLDMIFKDAINGTTHWVELVKSIKEKYPKPGDK